MKITVGTKQISYGFVVTVNKESHVVKYPSRFWQSFPENLRQSYAEFVAFMSTVHFAFKKNCEVIYQFPAPTAAPFFYLGLFLSMPENLLDFDALKTSDYLKHVMSGFYKLSFTGHTAALSYQPYTPHKNRAMVPFTFGKDSLLTYGLCKELGLKPLPIFFLEPTNVYENALKKKLIADFRKEFSEDIVTMQTPLADLKETRGLWWGWDIFLTQYTVFLIPYLHFYKPAYFFWSNEVNCNEVAADPEGFMFSGMFEQTGRWMQMMNTCLRIFGVPAKLGSLLEPLSEFAILAVLHHRYPALSRYQASCLNDYKTSSTQRWCGHCYECARVWISLAALGIDPHRIELNTNMLSRNKRTLYYTFSSDEKQEDLHQKFVFTRDEKLYVFYLAYERGLRGGLMTEFKKQFYGQVQKKARSFKIRYLTPHASLTVPEEMKKLLIGLFRKELASVKNKLIG